MLPRAAVAAAAGARLRACAPLLKAPTSTVRPSLGLPLTPLHARSFLSVSRLTPPLLAARVGRPALAVFGARTFFWSSNQKVVPAAATEPVVESASDGVEAAAGFPHLPAPPTTTLASDATVDGAASALSSSSSSAAVTTPSFLSNPSLLDASLQPEALTHISKIGDMHTLGLCNNTPAGLAQSFIEAVYVTTGLPWWATIMVATLIIRVALTPLTIKIQRTAAKMANIAPQITPLRDEMEKQRKAGDTKAFQATYAKMNKIHKREGVNPLGGLLALVQAPIFMAFFFGLKSMAEMPVPGFETGGVAWFTNLAAADPTFVLPVFASLSMLLIMEIGAEGGGQMSSKGVKIFMRGAMIVAIAFTAYLPAAIFMYWVSTNFFSLLQTLVLKNPKLRAMANIPPKTNQVVPETKGMTPVKKLSLEDSMKIVKAAAAQRQQRQRAAQESAKRIRKAADDVKRGLTSGVDGGKRR
ncbi:Mitochondrial inner membrane protein oxa1l [Geranomyces variabilis]|uniref:Mitochondrial inner membrane protein oxa1l n=1 Tax=Geranomyces variabilis TaxID=109894 RepID=A0AAD5XN22_9FUNG|nr:Mitochondrial inner membrane protein oxa1l [Geranomyces variabilis]